MDEGPLAPGRAWYVATYEHDDLRDSQQVDFDALDASGAARFAVDGGAFAALEKPFDVAALRAAIARRLAPPPAPA